MGIPYDPGMKATIYVIATHILYRQSQSQTNSVKAQNYGNSVLGPARCFAGELNTARNNDQLRCRLRNSTEAPMSIAKQTVWHAIKRCFVLHDNARSHISRATRELIESFGWDVLNHAPCSPDLVPSDFDIFWYLKYCLGGKHFSDNKEVNAVVNSWLSNPAADFFEEVFQNLILSMTSPSINSATRYKNRQKYVQH
ncbi:histone-lysine N-methyltransferase SETMAR [Trichonephila clavipes]|nr:histone-lysine N-methyltransferase SETMAR [Trichonephila clavipes]